MGKTTRKTTEEYKKLLKEKHSGKIICLEEYVNNTITYSPTVTINADGLTKEDAQEIVDNSLEKEFKKFKDENNW